MILAEVLFRKQSSRFRNGRIIVRHERLEAFYVDVANDSGSRVDTWPTIGPSPVTLAELLMRYEEEFRCSGYGPSQLCEV